MSDNPTEPHVTYIDVTLEDLNHLLRVKTSDLHCAASNLRTQAEIEKARLCIDRISHYLYTIQLLLERADKNETP